jgi:WhiB family redox-sensing transcriptional regulator
VSWRDQARCAGVGAGPFYPEGMDTRRAKAFCELCPVWMPCLAEGMDQDWGIWGGLNKAERQRLRRLRQRLRRSPADRANAVDVCRLLNAGLSPERLAVLLGVDIDAVLHGAGGVKKSSRLGGSPARPAEKTGVP